MVSLAVLITRIRLPQRASSPLFASSLSVSFSNLTRLSGYSSVLAAFYECSLKLFILTTYLTVISCCWPVSSSLLIFFMWIVAKVYTGEMDKLKANLLGTYLCESSCKSSKPDEEMLSGLVTGVSAWFAGTKAKMKRPGSCCPGSC